MSAVISMCHVQCAHGIYKKTEVTVHVELTKHTTLNLSAIHDKEPKQVPKRSLPKGMFSYVLHNKRYMK